MAAESSEPLVRAYASRDEQGALTIFIANNSPDSDFTAHIDISGMTAGTTGRSWLIEPSGLTLTGEEGPLQDLNGLSINGVFRPDPLELDQLPFATFTSGTRFDVEVLRSRMLLLRIPAAAPDSPDETPPSNAPAHWEKLPHATGSQSIAMEAASVDDPSGVQYSFDCIDGEGHDSGWQKSPYYEDTGVTTGAACTYVLRVRDMSKNRNEGPQSPPASAMTLSVDIPIAIDNGGFEQPGSGKQTNWESVPGWSSDSPASDSGVDQAFSTEGNWNGYLKGSDPSVWNVTDYTVQAGDLIELTFDARDDYDAWTRFRASLFWENDGVRTATASRDITMVRLFRTYTLSFAASDHPEAVGRRLGIEFDTTREGYVSIDRVQLHVRHLSNALYFAQFGEGLGQLSSQLIVMNLDRADPALTQLTLTDNGGGPITVDLNGQTVSGSMMAELPAGGLRSFRTDGLGPTVSGAVTVRSDRPLAGVILFGGPGGVAGVGSSTSLGSGFIAPMETNAAQRVATGVALMNLSDRANDIRFELYDQAGRLVSETSSSIGPNGHAAKFLDEILGETSVDLIDFTGLLKVTGSLPLAATVLRTSPGEFSTLPVEDLSSATSSSTGVDSSSPDTNLQSTAFALDFAHFGAMQGQLFSRLILVNPSTSDSAGATLSFRDNEGEPLAVDVNGDRIMGEMDTSIPALGVRTYESSGEGNEVATGSVRVTSDHRLAGSILFGGVVGVAGVGSSPEISSGFLAPVEQSASEHIRTGVALMSLDDLPLAIGLELLSPDAEVLATASLPLPGNGHVAKFVDELEWTPKVDLTELEGMLRATASGKISALILQSRPGQFATLPVVPFESQQAHTGVEPR